jgi:hypothetical protein
MNDTVAKEIDEAIDQLLQGVAAETARRRKAEERMDQMERDCAKAIEQACALAENTIAANKQEADRRGRLQERTWTLGLIHLVLEGLQENGAAAASLQSLKRMVEEGPIDLVSPIQSN